MHDLNVLISGPLSFTATLNELKKHLKFKIILNEKNTILTLSEKIEIHLIHENFFKENRDMLTKNKFGGIKILATNSDTNHSENIDGIINLPTTINELNNTIEKVVAKKKFNKNSSIKINDYLLDKNEKKISKNNIFVTLTEKEIQLLELLLKNKNPVSKNVILSTVWNYSTDADTHTVETHIYRLRKKIHDKFNDEDFILNNKNGYSL
tara:strand:- start:1467 stop:2093 length:627 start_codon:yes stop_codon:yes gene_type:complete